MSSAVDASNAQVARAQEGLRLKRGQIDKNHNDIAAAGAQVRSTGGNPGRARVCVPTVLRPCAYDPVLCPQPFFL